VRLTRFSIHNYRSIRSTPRIDVGSNLTIVGPNNEGKSNIVRALVSALRILEEHSQDRKFDRVGRRLQVGALRRPGLRREASYFWSEDCPVDLQADPEAKTRFYLEFQLSDQDVDEFHAEIGSAINGFLPIEIIVDRLNLPVFEVKKQGKARVQTQSAS
jgi:putative ATP-dependent endonuclease of the OLD family